MGTTETFEIRVFACRNRRHLSPIYCWHYLL